MRIMEDIRPVSYLKTNAANMLFQVNKTHRPVVITQNGEPRAVLQDPESYERMKAAINMMKLLAAGEEDAHHGRVIEQAKMFKDLKKELKRKKRDRKNP